MKKIYIHTDLEGISGIGDGDMVKVDSPDVRYCNERLMMDINAAIDGAFAGGANHVTVLDMHRGGGNFDLNLLDKRAEFDTNPNGKWWGILDDSYWGSFFIGAHAMPGTINGFLDHAIDSNTILNFSFNGRRVGELGMWAAVCGHFNVPLIMVSGDEAAVNEATQLFGDIEIAAVKRGISRGKARLKDNGEALDDIRQAAKRAVEKEYVIKPYKPILPLDIRIDFTRSDHCESWLYMCEKLERLDARSAHMVVNDYKDIVIWC